jgi:hypothetical protein
MQYSSHLESSPSIGENICFNFVRYYYAREFLEIKLPIIYQMRQILIAESLSVSEWNLAEWGSLLTIFPTLSKLRTLTFWFDTDRRWRNNKPRRAIECPRLMAFFAKVPSQIELHVSLPCDALDVPEDTPTVKGVSILQKFVDNSGGLVEGATIDEVVGTVTSNEA